MYKKLETAEDLIKDISQWGKDLSMNSERKSLILLTMFQAIQKHGEELSRQKEKIEQLESQLKELKEDKK